MRKTRRTGISWSVLAACIEMLEDRICLSGFFPTTKSVDVGYSPKSLIAVDSDANGKPDRLVTVNTPKSGTATTTLSVISVGGDANPTRGTDITAASVASGTGPLVYDVISSDFTGDGKPDLAIMRAAVAGETISQAVILTGDGAGNYSLSPTLKSSLSLFSFSMVSADVNKSDESGTGSLDLVLADADGGPILLLNDGQGHFAMQPPITDRFGIGNDNGAGTSVVITPDLNHDGKPDIVANQFAMTPGQNSLAVFLGAGTALQGNGHGFFTHPNGPSLVTGSSGTTGYGADIATGDFNHDGNPDLVVSIQSSNILLVFLGDGTGNFTQVNPDTPITLPTIGSVTPTAGQLVTGDFNGDTLIDVAVLQTEANGTDFFHPSNPGVSVLTGKGDGTFNAPVFTALPAGSFPSQLVAGKFNSDDSDDIAVTDDVYTGTTAQNGRIDVLLTKTQTQTSSTVVSNTGDSGPGSLRDAINTANSNPGPDTISFNIPGTGVQTITPATPLPALTGPVTIDGYTQPGATPNLVSISDNAHLLIHITVPTGGITGNALELQGGASTVKGLIIDGGWTADIVLNTAGGNSIQGNFLGVDVTATTATGGAASIGVSIASTSPNNTIGGTDPASRNIISGGGTGISISSNGNKVQGNFIGTDAAGTHDLGNAVAGITIQKGDKNAIGGKGITAGNVIAFSHKNGVNVVDGTSNSILNNSIHDNAKLGIDLKNNGVTKDDAVDADKGPNNLQNFPVITSAKISGNKIIINYSLTSVKGKTYRVEFFANAAVARGSSAQGTFFLGSNDVNIRTGNTVTGTLKLIAPSDTSLSVVTATATDPSNNTSEFSVFHSVTRTRTKRQILK